MDYDELEFSDFEPDYEFDVDDEIVEEEKVIKKDSNNEKECQPVTKSLNDLADEVFTRSAAKTEKYKCNEDKASTASSIWRQRRYHTWQRRKKNNFKVTDIVYPPTLCHNFVGELLEKAKEFSGQELKLIGTQVERSCSRNWKHDHRYLAIPRHKEMVALKKSDTPYGKCMQEKLKKKQQIEANKAACQDAFDKGEITQDELKIKLILNKIDRMQAEDDSRMYTQHMFGALHHILPLCLLFPREVKEMRSFEGLPIATQSLLDDKSFNAMLHNRILLLEKHRLYRLHKANPNYDMLLLVQDKNELMSLHHLRRECMKRFTVFKDDLKKAQFESRLRHFKFMVDALDKVASDEEVKPRLLYINQHVRKMELYQLYYNNQNDDEIKIRMYKEASFKLSPARQMFVIQKDFKAALYGVSRNKIRKHSETQRYELAVERWKVEDELRDHDEAEKSLMNNAQQGESHQEKYQPKSLRNQCDNEEEEDEVQHLDVFESVEKESTIDDDHNLFIDDDHNLFKNKTLDKFDSDTSYPISSKRQQEMYGNSSFKRKFNDNTDLEPKKRKSPSACQSSYPPTSQDFCAKKMPVLPPPNSSPGHQSNRQSLNKQGSQVFGTKENDRMGVRAFDSEHDRLDVRPRPMPQSSDKSLKNQGSGIINAKENNQLGERAWDFGHHQFDVNPPLMPELSSKSLNNQGSGIFGTKENEGMGVKAFDSERLDVNPLPMPQLNEGVGLEIMQGRIDFSFMRMISNNRALNPQLGNTPQFPPSRSYTSPPQFRQNLPYVPQRSFTPNPQWRASNNRNFRPHQPPFNGALHQNRMKSNQFMPPLPKLERFSANARTRLQNQLPQNDSSERAIPQQKCRYQPGLY